MRGPVKFPWVGSKLHSSFPVAASSAKARCRGDIAYRTPSITIGLDCISDPSKASFVSYVHATCSRDTFSGEICDSVV